MGIIAETLVWALWISGMVTFVLFILVFSKNEELEKNRWGTKHNPLRENEILITRGNLNCCMEKLVKYFYISSSIMAVIALLTGIVKNM